MLGKQGRRRCIPATAVVVNRLGSRMIFALLTFTFVELLVNRVNLNDRFEVELPEIYKDISSSILLEMPVSRNSQEIDSPFYRTSNLWQPLHENAVSINYEKEIYLLKNGYLSYLNRLCLKPLKENAPPVGDWLAYWDLLIVSRQDCPNYLLFVAEIDSKIGLPVKQTDDHLMWENPRRNNYD